MRFNQLSYIAIFVHVFTHLLSLRTALKNKEFTQDARGTAFLLLVLVWL